MSMLAAVGLRPALLSQHKDRALLAQRIANALESGMRAIVVDAADQGDLTRLAAALCSTQTPRVLAAGSAGLARALAVHVARRTIGARQAAATALRAGPVMAVVGSFSNASRAQVQQVEESGDAQVIRLDSRQWLDERHAFLRRNTLDAARESLRGGRSLLFAIGGEVAQPFSRSLVQAMARVTAPLLQDAAACVLTGGDTARAMFTELGVNRLEVDGEFEPGISLARAAPDALPAFALKAGGFGDALALRRIIRYFGRHLPQPKRQLAPY
jgi:4-hydroxythreonine-4-phosphate dehydrogenase